MIVSALVGPEADGTRLDSFLAAQAGCPSRSACADALSSDKRRVISPSPTETSALAPITSVTVLTVR